LDAYYAKFSLQAVVDRVWPFIDAPDGVISDDNVHNCVASFLVEQLRCGK
jgi:hypothetical protein